MCFNAVLLVGLWLLTATSGVAGVRGVTLVHDPADPIHQHFVAALTALPEATRLLAAGALLTAGTEDGEGLREILERIPDDTLVVTVGSRLFDEVLAGRGDATWCVLGALVPSAAFIRVRDAADGSTKQALSAVFVDPPPQRILHLGLALVPGVDAVGMVRGDRFYDGVGILEELAGRSAARLEVAEFREGQGSPARLFERLLGRVDLSLALPDALLLDPTHLRWYLYLAGQQRVPVVGYSRSLIEAGALGAVYVTPEQVARELDAQLGRWRREGWPAIAAPVYPVEFSVATNATIARRLGLSLPDDDQLERALRAAEGGR